MPSRLIWRIVKAFLFHKVVDRCHQAWNHKQPQYDQLKVVLDSLQKGLQRQGIKCIGEQQESYAFDNLLYDALASVQVNAAGNRAQCSPQDLTEQSNVIYGIVHVSKYPMNIALMDDVQDKTHAHHVSAREGHSPWWERSLYQTEGSMPQE